MKDLEINAHLLRRNVDTLEPLDRREVIGGIARQVQGTTLEVDDVHQGCGDSERGEVHDVEIVKVPCVLPPFCTKGYTICTENISVRQPHLVSRVPSEWCVNVPSSQARCPANNSFSDVGTLHSGRRQLKFAF